MPTKQKQAIVDEGCNELSATRDERETFVLAKLLCVTRNPLITKLMQLSR